MIFCLEAELLCTTLQETLACLSETGSLCAQLLPLPELVTGALSAVTKLEVWLGMVWFGSCALHWLWWVLNLSLLSQCLKVF